jgi:sorbitol-specific phosphotransferase system component IIC
MSSGEVSHLLFIEGIARKINEVAIYIYAGLASVAVATGICLGKVIRLFYLVWVMFFLGRGRTQNTTTNKLAFYKAKKTGD